jgi:hypothetical protein
MRKAMLVVAPVSHAPLSEIQNPVSPEAVAAEVLACAEEGRGWCTCTCGIHKGT